MEIEIKKYLFDINESIESIEMYLGDNWIIRNKLTPTTGKNPERFSI